MMAARERNNLLYRISQEVKPENDGREDNFEFIGEKFYQFLGFKEEVKWWQVQKAFEEHNLEFSREDTLQLWYIAWGGTQTVNKSIWKRIFMALTDYYNQKLKWVSRVMKRSIFDIQKWALRKNLTTVKNLYNEKGVNGIIRINLVNPNSHAKLHIKGAKNLHYECDKKVYNEICFVKLTFDPFRLLSRDFAGPLTIMLINDYEEHYGTAEIDLNKCFLAPKKWVVNGNFLYEETGNGQNLGADTPEVYVQACYLPYPAKRIEPDEPPVLQYWIDKFREDKPTPYTDPLAGLDGVLQVNVCNARGLLGSDSLDSTATSEFSNCSPLVNLKWKNFNEAQTD